MNKLLVLLLAFPTTFARDSLSNQFIARQGQVTFFSYASFENIEAENNHVLSLIDLDNQKIAISMLMRAFVFKKDLMHEHFNESYIESDMYPKTTFEGSLEKFNIEENGEQTRLINGIITIHGISKEIEVKTTISKSKEAIQLKGEFNLTVNDFNIKIPPILSNNIAKVVLVKFNLNYLPYESN